MSHAEQAPTRTRDTAPGDERFDRRETAEGRRYLIGLGARRRC